MIAVSRVFVYYLILKRKKERTRHNLIYKATIYIFNIAVSVFELAGEEGVEPSLMTFRESCFAIKLFPNVPYFIFLRPEKYILYNLGNLHKLH